MALADMKKDVNDADLLRLAREAQSAARDVRGRGRGDRRDPAATRHEPETVDSRGSAGRWDRPGSDAARRWPCCRIARAHLVSASNLSSCPLAASPLTVSGSRFPQETRQRLSESRRRAAWARWAA